MPRAALALACLLVLAGCGAAPPEPTETDTTTPAPVPGTEGYAPGIDGDGVASPVALANAHAAATAGSYRIVSNWTVRYANGSLRGRVDQHATVSPGAWTTTLRVGGPRPGIVARGNATAVFYSDGEVLAERVGSPNGVNYLFIPAAEYNGGTGFYNSLRRPKPYRDPGVLASAVELRTVAANATGATLAGDALSKPTLFATVVGVREPRNVSYRVRVATDGLVERQRLTYEGTFGGDRVVVTRTIRYVRFDGSVARPTWFETARNESVRG